MARKAKHTAKSTSAETPTARPPTPGEFAKTLFPPGTPHATTLQRIYEGLAVLIDVNGSLTARLPEIVDAFLADHTRPVKHPDWGAGEAAERMAAFAEVALLFGEAAEQLARRFEDVAREEEIRKLEQVLQARARA